MKNVHAAIQIRPIFKSSYIVRITIKELKKIKLTSTKYSENPETDSAVSVILLHYLIIIKLIYLFFTRRHYLL